MSRFKRLLVIGAALLVATSGAQVGSPLAGLKPPEIEYNPALIFNPTVQKDLKLTPAKVQKLQSILMQQGIKMMPMMSGNNSKLTPAQRQKLAGRARYRGYARNVGLAFQIADDLLDTQGDEEAAGKKLRKDEEAGKATFVSLLGAERAHQQASMLVTQAIEHLHGHGEEAELLRAIARYAVERDR